MTRQTDAELSGDELENQTAEALPDREAMSIVDLGPDVPIGPLVLVDSIDEMPPEEQASSTDTSRLDLGPPAA